MKSGASMVALCALIACGGDAIPSARGPGSVDVNGTTFTPRAAGAPAVGSSDVPDERVVSVPLAPFLLSEPAPSRFASFRFVPDDPRAELLRWHPLGAPALGEWSSLCVGPCTLSTPLEDGPFEVSGRGIPPSATFKVDQVPGDQGTVDIAARTGSSALDAIFLGTTIAGLAAFSAGVPLTAVEAEQRGQGQALPAPGLILLGGGLIVMMFGMLGTLCSTGTEVRTAQVPAGAPFFNGNPPRFGPHGYANRRR